MKDKSAEYRKIIREALIVKNPALIEAIGLFPIVAVSTSLKAAVLVSVSSFLVLIITSFVASLLLKKVPRFIRVALYMLIGTGILLPLSYLFFFIAPNESASMGIALPLICVNSFVSLHCERYCVKLKLDEAMIHAVFSGIGYCAVVLVTGAVREFFGNGTLFDYPIKFAAPAKLMLLPCGGLIVLGFFAAIFRILRLKLYPHYSEEAASDIIIEEASE